ncbi:MAG: U32 family peptidase [Blautia sp.]|nr:U32 family peptidase [Blautia sp.]
MKDGHIELLSPAGSFEGFQAVLRAGADAVYLGGELFGARAYARNFTGEEILRAIDQAHLHQCRIYLTVNTLMKNKELEERLIPFLTPFYKEGLDAVLVQDFGVLSVIRRCFPDLPVHASTQMTVTGPESMKLLKELGVTRVVPARELSLRQIRRMHEACDMEIETFIHGALCYSYSGVCLMSSLIGGRSGNRGRCAQPCRLTWQAEEIGGGRRGSGKNPKGKRPDQKEGCLLSMKDLMTLDILPDILEAGVVSLKIEGRMKQPEYQAGVTRIYRKYLDRLLSDGPERYRVDPEDRRMLLELYSRGGSCTGYYKMKNGPEMIAFSNDRKTADRLSKNQSMPDNDLSGKILIDGTVRIRPDEPVTLTIRASDGYEGTGPVSVQGEMAQRALGRALDEAAVRRQLEKLGGTPFAWNSLQIDLSEGTFAGLKALNEVRREAVEKLESGILDGFRREMPGLVTGKKPAPGLVTVKELATEQLQTGEICLTASCEDVQTGRILLAHPDIHAVYFPVHVMEELWEEGIRSGKALYLALPHISTQPLTARCRELLSRSSQHLSGFLVRDLESFAMLCSEGLQDRCILDHSLYTWNQEAVRFWKKMGVYRLTAPLELSEGELRHRDNSGSEMVIYGRAPAMVSSQCVVKNTRGCTRRNEMIMLRDRTGAAFPVQCSCAPWNDLNTEPGVSCYNIIYNSLPCSLLKDREQVLALGMDSLRLAFTVETPEQVRQVLDAFGDVYLRNGEASLPGQTTRGHFRRGAE